jgi:hypothetical protein
MAIREVLSGYEAALILAITQRIFDSYPTSPKGLVPAKTQRTDSLIR